MPKEYTDPVADEDGREQHPGFGVISVHRISATPGESLFQSDLRHNEYVVIEVHEADRIRDLKHDWVHPRARVFEASMSMSQFASFVASGGTEGVPCTIEFTGSGKQYPAGQRPGIKYAPRLSLTRQEVSKAAVGAFDNIKEAYAEVEAANALVGKGAAAARKTAMRNLQSCIGNAAPNVAYAAQVLDRHSEEVVEKARADIEAIAVRAAEKMGLPEGSLLAIEEGYDAE